MKIGVDLGGTNLRVALVTPEGEIKSIRQEATCAQAGPEAITRQLTQTIQSLPQWEQADFIGIGVPGVVRDGVVWLANNLPGMDGFPLEKRLEDALCRSVAMDNDANVACLGEALLGAGKGYRSVAYMTISTGIGGGMMVDGHLLRGAHCFAGEFGCVSLWPEGEIWNELPPGAAESYASGDSLTRRANTQGRAYRHAGDVFAAAQKGDAAMAKLKDDFVLRIAALMNNVACIVDPEVFVLGGGCMNSADAFWKDLCDTYQRFAHSVFRQVPILRAQLEQPGLVGAALLEQA